MPSPAHNKALLVTHAVVHLVHAPLSLTHMSYSSPAIKCDHASLRLYAI
jgi:hypothetical protein